MTRSRKMVARTAVAAAIAAVLFGFPLPAAAAVDCTADVRAETDRDEVQDKYVDKNFRVEISSTRRARRSTST